MKLLYICTNPGTRPGRMFFAPMMRGHEFHVASIVRSGIYSDLYASHRTWSNRADLHKILSESHDFDAWIVHVQASAPWLASDVIDRAPKHVRVILDARDIPSLYGPYQVSFEELHAFCNADGIIHVSLACARWSHRLHGEQNSIVVHSKICHGEKCGCEQREGVVYCGGITVGDSHRDYRELFKHFPGINIQSGVGDGCRELYPNTFWHRTVSPELTVHSLRSYKYGLVGFGKDFLLGQCAMPNKLFEYLAAGVVPIVANCEAAAHFVTHNHIGYVLPADFSLPTEEQYQEYLQNIKLNPHLYLHDDGQELLDWIMSIESEPKDQWFD